MNQSFISTVKNCIQHDDGLCTLLITQDGEEQTVECESVLNGWYPDKDDVVRIIKDKKMMVVEPVGWETDVEDSEKNKAAELKKENRERRRDEQEKQRKENEKRAEKERKEREKAEKEQLKKLAALQENAE